jgi:hypothetical protein
MPTYKAHILRILGEAEPLSTSEIADRLNRGLGPAVVYTSLEIVARLKRMSDLEWLPFSSLQKEIPS